MAIVQKQAPPASGQNMLGNALQDLWGKNLSALGGKSVNFSQPLPVYILHLKDIDGPKSSNKAKLIGWRYLLEKADGAFAYADVLDHTGKQTFAGVAANKNAERLNEATHVAEIVAKNLPDCEARILDVPSLHLSAIWLFGSQETFIPFIDPEKFRGPASEVSVDPNFMNRLTARAEEMRSHLGKFEPQEKTTLGGE